MPTPFTMFFDHNRWANLRVLEACSALSDEMLDASRPGIYGSLRETLVHLVGGEELYIWLLTKEEPVNRLHRGEFPGFDDLRQRLQHSGERLVEIAATIQPGQTVQDDRGDVLIELPAMMILLQAINHATEHRTNITTILAQHQQAAPDVDGWAYWEQVLQPPSA